MSSNASPDPLADLRNAGWLVIGAGAVSIVAGLLAIAYPDITLLALAIFAGVNIIVLSGLSLVDAFGARADTTTRTLSALLGILGLIAGLVLLRRPGETLLALLLVLGIWLVVYGVAGFFVALHELREDRAARMLVALADLALGILILSLPDLSLRTVAILAGIGFIVRGVFGVYAGWQLRKAGHAAPAGRAAPAA
jgi:uncharacterized membrane protein HdeD (DUF308 family)